MTNPSVIRRYIAAAPPSVIGTYVLAYLLLDWASYIYPAVPPFAITPWNPPPGLSLALLLRFGPQCAPWAFIATFAAELLVRGVHSGPVLLFLMPALPVAAYSVLAIVLRGPLRFDANFSSRRDAAIFVAAAAVATALLTFAVVGLLRGVNLLDAAVATKALTQYWIGDLLGIFVTTPLLLVFSRWPRPRLLAGGVEAAAQVLAVVISVALVFGVGKAEELKLFYLLFLPLIWVAMRHGVEGTVIATALVQVGMIVAMLARGYEAESVLQFQFLLLSVALTGLFLGVAVSEQRGAAEQLRIKQEELDRSLRLAAASEIASALAHELNQPLFAIDSYVEACQMMLADRSPALDRVRGTIDKAAADVRRASEVVRRLRAFFRFGTSRIVPTDVRAILQSAIESNQRRLIRHGVQWQVQCGPLPNVAVDRVQIEMVLHNLIANAIDALKQVAPDTRQLTLAAAPAGAHAVRISVTDAGPGVPADIAERLFSAFTSGKPDGMGLGLAISKSIVEAHGGRLWHEAAGSGAAFHLELPATEPHA